MESAMNCPVPRPLLLAILLTTGLAGCNQSSKLDTFQQRHGQGLSVARDMAGKITAIRFESTPLTDHDLQLLGEADALKELSGDASQITDAGFAALATCSQLESLQLKSCKLSDSAAKSIGALSKLIALDLTDASELTPTRLASLGQLSKLSTLCLRGTAIDDACIPHLPDAPLKSLSLANTKITSAGTLEVHVRWPDLEILQLDGLPLDSNALQTFSRFPKLAELSLGNCSVGDDALTHLAACQLLRVLDLSDNTALTDPAIKSLGNLPELRTINVSGTQFTGNDFSSAGFPVLASLVADRTMVSKETLRTLKLPTLFSLSLRGCSLTEQEIRSVFSTNDQTAVSFDQAPPEKDGEKKVRGQI
jgi:hypothetical protein